MNVELTPAFVLHSRPHRETSLIVDLLSRDYGRVTVVARGARGKKSKSSNKGLLLPFSSVLVSFLGKGAMKTLTHVEMQGQQTQLEGVHLYSALYINELLIRLLHVDDSHPDIYHAYSELLQKLMVQDRQALEPCLRNFEFQLLTELGYGLSFAYDGETHDPINIADTYYFLPDQGFIKCRDTEIKQLDFTVTGEILRAISIGDYSNNDVRMAAKKIVRLALKPLLGSKPLKSREMFN